MKYPIMAAFSLALSTSGCKYLSFSDIMTRNASSQSELSDQCYLAMSSGLICQISPSRCTQASAVLHDVRNLPTSAQKDILSDAFVQNTLKKTPQNSPQCDSVLEVWALKTLSLRKPAPFDVATLAVPGLQEIKLLIWGGGMMAGFLGDGVGSACMSALGAGLSYAESKSWITCKR